ncbi:MAG: YraN family protein [bacterium]|nr:YraN family protein [bacterium]
MFASKKALGNHGERLAEVWYRAAGYTIIGRNIRCGRNEADLLCGSGKTVIIVEVKTRSSKKYGPPLEAIYHRKLLRLASFGQEWIRKHPKFTHWQVDIIGLAFHPQACFGSLDWLPNVAITMPESSLDGQTTYPVRW